MSEVERKIEQPAVSETPTGTRPETMKVNGGVNCTLCGAPRSRLVRKTLSHVAGTATRLFFCDACGGYWSDVTPR
jgi:hypothetical protein